MKHSNNKNIYMRRITLMLCLLLTLQILSGFRAVPQTEDWGTSPTGSAKYLDGSTVLVSLFIEDPSSIWTTDKKELVMSKMDIATDFLVSEGNSYGKSVNLIYDIYEHPDLEYTVSYPETIRDSDRSSFLLLKYVTHYIETNIPTQEILTTYNVDSIAYMCFLDKSGVSFTFPYYEGDSDIYYYETCYMYLKCDGDFEPPSVYAHEMLHLFGARDLYSTNETDGITKEFVQYIESNYSNEIMLTTYDENWDNVQDYVSNDLTDITAYFIGWLDQIPELETFPSIYYPYSASFGDVHDDSGNYSDYSAGDFDEPDSNSRWGSNTEAAGSGWGSKTGDSSTSDSNTGNNSTGWNSGSHWGEANSTEAPEPANTGSDYDIWDFIWDIIKIFFG